MWKTDVSYVLHLHGCNIYLCISDHVTDSHFLTSILFLCGCRLLFVFTVHGPNVDCVYNSVYFCTNLFYALTKYMQQLCLWKEYLFFCILVKEPPICMFHNMKYQWMKDALFLTKTAPSGAIFVSTWALKTDAVILLWSVITGSTVNFLCTVVFINWNLFLLKVCNSNFQNIIYDQIILSIQLNPED